MIEVFRGESPEHGRHMAFELSAATNEALKLGHSKIRLPASYDGTRVAAIVGRQPVNYETVAAPWEAYMLARRNEDHRFYLLQHGFQALLATIPLEYKLKSEPLGQIMGPYADSLVAHLADLINTAERELLVVAPYWSEEGVRDLSRRLHTRKDAALKATLVTAVDAKDRDREGVELFKHTLRRNFNAEINHVEPIALTSGRAPLMHAKVIVADRKRAYVGSANFSQSGLRDSIEMGVSLAGSAALQVARWFDSLLNFTVDVKLGGEVQAD